MLLNYILLINYKIGINKKMNRNTFYLNRIIKIISPFTFQTFKIELNGEENELRELLATILEINPNSIKGLRDSYNNYYTLSSAVNNPHINTSPYNYYTVVIKDSQNHKNSALLKPSFNYNLLKEERIHTLPNENNINYHTNFMNNTYNFFEDNNFNEENINMNNLNYYNNGLIKNHDIDEYLNFADDLYKKNYIDYKLIKKLKRLIIENNNEVLTIMSPYINLKSYKSYDEFTKKIIPIISARSPISDNSQDSSSSSSSSSSSDSEKSKKKTKLSKQEKIIEDIRKKFPKKEYTKLKNLLKNKDKKLLKAIKHYQKNKDYNKLLTKLTKLINSEEDNKKEKNDDVSEKSNKNKNEVNEKDIKKIVKIIINSLKNKGIDIYYVAKYDLQKINNEEKISLFTKKFKLPIESIINDDNYKIPKKNMTLIKSYYTEYIAKKITKNLDENEIIIYEGLLEQKEENNIIINLYKDLLKHKNINELKNQIKQLIKEAVENIEEEEGEEEEEDDEEDENNNEGKTLIKEENEEEEEDDEEGEEEEDEKDSKNDDNKSSSNKSSENIIILNDDNKDRGINLLNNNYRKINNYNYSNNKMETANNDNNNDKKDEQNLGLGFVVIKQKNTSNNILKLNTTDSKQNESSLSTNNPNKKLNQFIQQIEHMKKIDDIKKTILESINNNNKYIMDLFNKFQKNKLNLNPKSLLEVYKQIKENPDTNNKENIFKSLIEEVPNITKNIKEFLCNQFINKNSELETFFNLYEQSQEKDDFIESIEMFLKKPASKKLLEKYNINQIKKEIEPKLSQNEDMENKTNEIIKLFEKYNLFNDKEINLIKDLLKKNDKVISASFSVLFDDKDFDEFYDTLTIALNQANKGGNKK